MNATAVGARTRIVLVDDHTLFRDGLRQLLEMENDLSVVGEAATSAQAVRETAVLRPDVVLLDVQIPGDHVTATVRRIAAASPDTRVIILSMYDRAELLRDLITLGISGYLLKTVGRHELVAAVRASREGRVTFSVSPGAIQPGTTDLTSPLTERELQVLRLAGSAFSNAQIARRLALTEASVKRHMRNIFSKLGAVSRLDAVNKAIAANLLAAARPDE